MSLKDKNLVAEAKSPYGVDVKAFYYRDVKEAVQELNKRLKEDFRIAENDLNLQHGHGAENQINNTWNYIEEIFGDFDND